MDPAHQALLEEIRRRLQETRDDPNIKNANGSNYWGPYVTRAVEERAEDGPALVAYVQTALRKPTDLEAFNALRQADRLDLSFEDLVANADEPIRSLFTDEDREIATASVEAQRAEIDQRLGAAEAVAVEHDRRIVAQVAESRRAAGKPWTDEIETEMLARRADRRRAE